MTRISKNSCGFSAVEVFIVVVIAALVGVVGWTVYKNHSKKVVVQTPAPQTTQKPVVVVKPAVDPTFDWQTIKNPNGTWSSVKIPKNWLSLVCDGGTYIGVAPDKASLGICNSGAVSKLAFSFSTDKNAANPLTKSADDKIFADMPVTVNGVQGHKYTVIKNTGPDVMYSGYGYVTYVFTSMGKVFTASYVQNVSQNDDTLVADEIVHTWQF